MVSTIEGPAADERWYSCPVAAASRTWVHRVFVLRRRMLDGESLRDQLGGAPSAQLRRAIDVAGEDLMRARRSQERWEAELARAESQDRSPPGAQLGARTGARAHV